MPNTTFIADLTEGHTVLTFLAPEPPLGLRISPSLLYSQYHELFILGNKSSNDQDYHERHL